MAKARRGSRAQPAPAEAARSMLERLEHDFGVGVIVQSIDEGPPVAIVAALAFGTFRREVAVEGSTEAEAWHALAREIAAWRQSNEVSIINNWWGAG